MPFSPGRAGPGADAREGSRSILKLRIGKRRASGHARDWPKPVVEPCGIARVVAKITVFGRIDVQRLVQIVQVSRMTMGASSLRSLQSIFQTTSCARMTRSALAARGEELILFR